MKREDSLASMIALLGVLVALGSQWLGRQDEQRVKETSDAYLLPPPKYLVKMSLGHRSAVADLLWANLLVVEGLRLGERRRFDVAVEYLNAINELDPTWRDPYRMADSLVTLQAQVPPLEQVYAVREILERGVRERPMDAELWLVLGQFVGQVAPGTFFGDDLEEARRWQSDGSEYLARAAELAPSDTNISWQSLGGARVLARSGRTDRAIEMYSTILMTTDDPELRARIEGHLAALYQQGHAEDKQRFAQLRSDAFELLRVERYPGTRKPMSSLLGPPRDAPACAGGARAANGSSPACAGTWRRWGELEPSGYVGSR